MHWFGLVSDNNDPSKKREVAKPKFTTDGDWTWWEWWEKLLSASQMGLLLHICAKLQVCNFCWELCNFKKDANRLVWWVNIVYPDLCLVVHLFENPARVVTYCNCRSIRSSKSGFLDAIYWGRWLLEPLHPCNPLCLGQRNDGYHGYRVMLHGGWVIL